MNNGKLLLASALLAGTVLVSALVLKKNYSSMYQPLAESSVLENKAAAQAAGAQQWWFNLRKDENGEMNYERMAKTLDQVSKDSKRRAVSTAWNLTFNELGPDNVGGRTRALCFDHADHRHMFAGGVSGGLWESHDGGSTWQHSASSDQYDVMTITSIAQGADGTWFFGTGEAVFYPLYGQGSGGFIGGGIWRSRDNGVTWARLSSTGPVNPTNPSTRWAGIGRIATDPTNAARIYAGTFQGMMVSSDTGTTWTLANSGMGSSVYDVDVASDHTVYAVVASKLWRSPSGDVGSSWVAMTAANGYPISGNGRAEVAIAPQDPNYVYVVIAAPAGTLAGVYMSGNAASGTPMFSQIAGAGNLTFDPFSQQEKQGSYDMTMAVDPFDKNHIVLGGVSLWRWDMSNNNPSAPNGQWTNIAQQFGGFGNLQYEHTDNHMILFDDQQQGKFYIGCDGGLYRSLDNGNTYYPINKGYRVTQYYDIACDYSDVTRTMNLGGCQDNGTQFINGLGNTAASAASVGGGDGGGVEFSFLNPNAVFGTVYYGSLARSSNRGGGANSFYSPRFTPFNIGSGGAANFVTPIRLHETLNDPNSQDSVLFIAQRQSMSIATGTDTTAIYSYNLKCNYNGTDEPNATIIPGTVLVTAGTMSCTDDGAGNITGTGLASGSINYSTRHINLTFADTPTRSTVIKVAFDVTYNAGVQLMVSSHTSSIGFAVPSPSTITSLGPNDSIYIKDVIQAKLAVGLASANGLFVTNKPLDFSTIPLWVKVAGYNSVPDPFSSGVVQFMTFSKDGNSLFFSNDGGGIWRVDGINFIRDSIHSDIDTKVGGAIVANPLTPIRCTQIGTTAGNGGITAIDVDPSNPDNLIVAVANYIPGTHVYYMTNATTAPSNKTSMANFTSVQGNLPSMPVYSCSFDKYKPGAVLIGTDFGIYSTDNVTNTPVSWTSQANLTSTFPHVPTLQIHQSRFEPWNGCKNSGVFYIATHGRGTWKSEVSYTPLGINDIPSTTRVASASSLLIFPNPMVGTGHVSFNLGKSGDVKLYIFSLSGKLVKQMLLSHLQDGLNTVEFDCSDFSAGTYIMSFESGSQHTASRFIVTK